jgi:acyl-CoA thioesterase-1
MNFKSLLGAACVVWLAAVACGSGESTTELRPATPDARERVSGGTAAPEPPGDTARPRVVALGDSLTAGLGLSPEQAYPALLQQRLDQAGLAYEVVNAGVSGDTSAGGLRRLDWALQGEVHVLILALGGNDGLRGLPADHLRQNLAQMIERAQSRGIEIVLAGMEAPPNFGSAYVAAFRQVYPALASQYRAALVPFLLEGVAGIESMNQRDGIHPNAAGARRVADNLWTVLRPILERASPRPRGERASS